MSGSLVAGRCDYRVTSLCNDVRQYDSHRRIPCAEDGVARSRRAWKCNDIAHEVRNIEHPY